MLVLLIGAGPRPKGRSRPSASSAGAPLTSPAFLQMLRSALYNLDLIGGGQVRLAPLLPAMQEREQADALQKTLEKLGRADVEAVTRNGGLYLRKRAPE